MSRRVGIVLASTCSDETAAAVSDLALLGRMASGEPSPAWASRGRLGQRRRHAQQRRRLQGGFRHRRGFATRQRARSCGSGSTPQTWVGTTCQSPTADSAASPRTEWITAGSQRAHSTARCRSEPAMNPDPTVTEGDIARASVPWGYARSPTRCAVQVSGQSRLPAGRLEVIVLLTGCRPVRVRRAFGFVRDTAPCPGVPPGAGDRRGGAAAR